MGAQLVASREGLSSMKLVIYEGPFGRGGSTEEIHNKQNVTARFITFWMNIKE